MPVYRRKAKGLNRGIDNSDQRSPCIAEKDAQPYREPTCLRGGDEDAYIRMKIVVKGELIKWPAFEIASYSADTFTSSLVSGFETKVDSPSLQKVCDVPNVSSINWVGTKAIGISDMAGRKVNGAVHLRAYTLSTRPGPCNGRKRESYTASPTSLTSN